MKTAQDMQLSHALQRLSELAVVPGAAKFLVNSAESIAEELQAAVLGSIPAFSASGNPDVMPGLAQHARAHTQELLRLVAGGQPEDLEFVRTHAERRAEQRFPLEATLHAYRCAHKVFVRWMRDAAVAMSSQADPQEVIAAIADFAIEYTDAISTVATSAYVSQTRLLARVEGNERAELLRILLDGYDESDGRVAKELRNAGYLDQRQSFCVALAQPVEPAEMLNAGRAHRLVEAIHDALDKFPARTLIELRDNTATIIMSYARRLSGWTEPRTAMAERAKSALAVVGPAALIGVSNDVPSTSHIPTAHREAKLALEVANVGNRVVQFSDISMQRLLLHMAGDEIRRVLPRWSKAFLQADRKSKGALRSTLRAYADADMNLQRAAIMLKLHPNTVYARLARIEGITGLDARSFHSLTELLIVANCRR